MTLIHVRALSFLVPRKGQLTSLARKAVDKTTKMHWEEEGRGMDVGLHTVDSVQT